MTDPTGDALRARYTQYYTTFTRAGITPLSYDLWLHAMKLRPYKATVAPDFDIETEQREGWGYDKF